MTVLLRFVIDGRPARWQRTGGKGRARYTEADMRRAKKHVATCARAAMRAMGLRKALEGPLVMVIDTYRPRKRDATPDWDNLGKLVSDALNKVAYRDDAQVVSGTVNKHDTRQVGGAERTVVVITLAEDEEQRVPAKARRKRAG